MTKATDRGAEYQVNFILIRLDGVREMTPRLGELRR